MLPYSPQQNNPKQHKKSVYNYFPIPYNKLMTKKLYIKKINDKFEPDYLKGWQEANEQFWVNKNKLFIHYDEDHDEEGLTDVSNQYDWEIRSK